MKIICISGKRGSGKTLLAKCLEPYGYKRLSLARELKDICMRDFGLTLEHEKSENKELPTGYLRTNGEPLTARDIWIRCGMYYRSIDPLYWCRKVYEKLDAKDGKYVIDDIRFLNEVEYFQKLGSKFVRIERSQELNIFKAALDDLSETELDNFKDWDALLLENFNRIPHDLEMFAEYLVTKL